jgi:hypothetical protein
MFHLNVCFVKRRANLGGQILRAQIYGQGSILEPPFHSTFKGGGGPELSVHVSMAWIGEPGSMVKVGFQTPFAYLPLIGGGGGPELDGLKWAPPLSRTIDPRTCRSFTDRRS